MATTSFVNTDNVGSTDGTTVATGWTSLSSAISNLPATFVDDYIIQCSGTAADTTAATFSGKTFSTFNVQVVGNAAEADGFNDTEFEYSTSHYRLDQTGSGTSIDLSTGPVTLDGIQVSQKSGNFARAVLAAPGSGMAHTVKNCRVKGNTGTGNGCLYFIPRSSGSSIAQNNVIVGASSNDSGVHVKVTNFFNTLTIYITGNSIKDFSATTGGGIELEDASGHSSSTCIIENNAVIDCGDDYNTASAGAGFSTFSLDYNGGDDADLSGTTNGVDLGDGTEPGIWEDHFTDPNASAGSIDLTPVASGGLDGAGTTGTGILSTDILGTAHNSPQDIGAFALAAAGGGATVTATKGDLILAGKAASVAAARRRTAAATKGALALAGKAATVTVDTGGAAVNVAATKGALLLSGKAATVQVARRYAVTATKGSLLLSGKAATVSLGTVVNVSAAKGALLLSGKAATVSVARRYTAQATAGFLTLEGKAATVVKSGLIPVDATKGTIDLTGHAAIVGVTGPSIRTVPDGGGSGLKKHGRKRQSRYPRRIMIDGVLYVVNSAAEERALLEAKQRAVEAQALELIQEDAPKTEVAAARVKVVKLQRRIDKVDAREDEWLDRLRSEDDEILMAIH